MEATEESTQGGEDVYTDKDRASNLLSGTFHVFLLWEAKNTQ